MGARLAEHRRRVQYSLETYSRPPGVAVQRWQWNARQADAGADDDEPLPGLNSEPTSETIIAELNYFATIPRSAADAVFDDRGLIYIRHGEPDRKANHSGVGHLYNESWLYRRPVSPLVLHFHTPTLNPSDFRLVDRPVGGLMTACQVDAAYCVLAANRSTGREAAQQRERTRQIEQARIDRARGSDGVPPAFAKDISGVVRSYSLPSFSGETLLLTAIALPQAAMCGEPGPTSSCNFGIRFSAAFRDGRGIIQQDTTLEQSAFHELDRENAAALVMFRSPPGTADLTVLVRDSLNDRGILARERRFEIRHLGDGITVSDIILGHQRGALRFRYDTVDVQVDPRNVFVPNDTLTAFYIVTGIAPAAQIRTELEIRSENKSRISLSFQEQGSAGTEIGLRSIDLKDLRPGRYSVLVKVTEVATNRVGSWAQEFTVVRR
jgi:hypothetical protein